MLLLQGMVISKLQPFFSWKWLPLTAIDTHTQHPPKVVPIQHKGYMVLHRRHPTAGPGATHTCKLDPYVGVCTDHAAAVCSWCSMPVPSESHRRDVQNLMPHGQ